LGTKTHSRTPVTSVRSDPIKISTSLVSAGYHAAPIASQWVHHLCSSVSVGCTTSIATIVIDRQTDVESRRQVDRYRAIEYHVVGTLRVA